MTLGSLRYAFVVLAVVALAASVAAEALSTSGRAGAPGQLCKHLKVKGRKTDDQRAAFKKCVQHKAGITTNARNEDEPAKSRTTARAGAPGQVCKHLKVRGKKTGEQRAAFKKCIQHAVAKRNG